MIVAPAPAIVSLSALKPIGEKYVNPHAPEAERIAGQLCQDLGIALPNIDEYITMASYLFPTTSLERLVAMILLNNLLFYIDDVYDRHKDDLEQDGTHLYGVFLDAAKLLVSGDKKLIQDEAILKVAYELHVQFTRLISQNWLNRFVVNLMAHLKSSLTHLEDTSPGDGTLLDRYLSIRDNDSGMEADIDLIEFAMGCVLGSHIHEHPVVREARQQVARYSGLSNDVFSFSKEVVHYGSEFNLLAVMMQDGASFDEAVDKTIVILNGMVDKFKTLEAQLPLFKDDIDNYVVSNYFEAMRYQITAAYHWQFDTRRYKSAQSPFIELQGF